MNTAISLRLVALSGFCAVALGAFGSLYILALSGIHWLGAITPLGGLAFLAGWLFLGLAASRFSALKQ